MDQGIFSPATRRIRGGSVASHQQDRALDEVFRRPYRGSMSIRQTSKVDIPNAGGVVASWMKGVVSPTGSPPTEFEDRFTMRGRAIGRGRRNMIRYPKRDSYGTIEEMRKSSHLREPPRSVISDPGEFLTGGPDGLTDTGGKEFKTEIQEIIRTDDDGDDEANSRGEEEEDETEANDTETHDLDKPASDLQADGEEEQQGTPTKSTPTKGSPVTPSNSSFPKSTPTKSSPVTPSNLSFPKPPHHALRKQFAPYHYHHARTNSTQTIRHSVGLQSSDDEQIIAPRLSRRNSEQTPENSSGKRSSPRSSRPQTATRARQIFPPRKYLHSVPNLEGPPHLMVPSGEPVGRHRRFWASPNTNTTNRFRRVLRRKWPWLRGTGAAWQT
jgi:hypothetical protein